MSHLTAVLKSVPLKSLALAACVSVMAIGIAGCAPGYYDHDGYWHADRYRGYEDHGYYDRDEHRDSDRRWTCNDDGGDCHWEYRDRD